MTAKSYRLANVKILNATLRRNAKARRKCVMSATVIFGRCTLMMIFGKMWEVMSALETASYGWLKN